MATPFQNIFKTEMNYDDASCRNLLMLLINLSRFLFLLKRKEVI